MNGVERLKKLAEGQEDPPLLRVIEYLVNIDDMSDKYLNETKTLKGMVDYIKGEAKRLTKDGYCQVEDATVYEWAVNYWNKTDEELGIKKVISTPTVKVNKEEVVPEVQKVGQLSLFQVVWSYGLY